LTGRTDRLAIGLFLLGLTALAFVAGSYFFYRGWPPATEMRRAFVAAGALRELYFGYDDPRFSPLWHEARDAATGVVTCDPGAMEPGLTLFTSGDAPQVLLMRADGEIVHRWTLPTGAVTGEEKTDPFTYLRKAHLFPNGDVLTFFEKVDVSPAGLAMVRMNAAGEVIWALDRPIHHDFDIAPDGRIVALDTNIVGEPFGGIDRERFPLMDDEIVVVSPEGVELDRLSLMRAMLDSPWPDLIDLLPLRTKGDHMHVNSIVYVTAELARVFPFVEEGQVVVSIREGDRIAAVDLEEKRITWTVHGYWLRQHDVDLLPNGHFLIFDNHGDLRPGTGRSRVVEVDPSDMSMVWMYGGTQEEPLESWIRSSQSRLANGNTLITESDQGRLLEVTPDGRIVWDYRWTGRDAQDPMRTAVLSWGERVDPATLDASFRDGLALDLSDTSCVTRAAAR